MAQFSIRPTIVQLDTVEEFCRIYGVGEGDLLFVSAGTYGRFFQGKTNGAMMINYREFGKGEPTDQMVEGICERVRNLKYTRVIAVGGGTILDVAKLFALKHISPVVDLYDGKLQIEKEKELVLVPTTCGTGSEVTNISILELTAKHTKMGLAVEALYADAAVLIPELLNGLPFSVFATSSIDALIHSIESYTSPKANAFTRMYSRQAMKMILETYQKIVAEGAEARKVCLKEMLLASTFAGIAFGNAGCAAVHAMSYPLGATYHVPHGEANYAMFTAVYKAYQERDPEGSIQELNQYLAGILKCAEEDVYEKIEELLNHVLPKKPLHEYGVTKEDLNIFTETVMTKQGRLMANNYVELDARAVMEIYETVY